MRLIALDFETDAIEPRPKYPPEPQGCAIMVEDQFNFYWAWGHPTKNNCDKATGYREVAEFFEDPQNEIIMHNAAFDCAVAQKFLQVTIPWERVHDTMLLAFLADPFGELSLKPLSEKLLGMPPDEQDAVREWLVSHGVCRSNDKGWGAYICKAPGDLVGTYAIGDVERTLRLFKHFKNGGSSAAKDKPQYKPDLTSGVGGRANKDEPYWASGSVPNQAYGYTKEEKPW